MVFPPAMPPAARPIPIPRQARSNSSSGASGPTATSDTGRLYNIIILYLGRHGTAASPKKDSSSALEPKTKATSCRIDNLLFTVDFRPWLLRIVPFGAGSNGCSGCSERAYDGSWRCLPAYRHLSLPTCRQGMSRLGCQNNPKGTCLPPFPCWLVFHRSFEAWWYCLIGIFALLDR